MVDHLQSLLNAAEERERNESTDSLIPTQIQYTAEAEEADKTTENQDTAMQTHLQQLLDAAEAREKDSENVGESSTQFQSADDSCSQTKSNVTTRSQGKSLKWNPEMNASEAVIENWWIFIC